MKTLLSAEVLTTAWQGAGLLVGAAIFVILFTIILTTLRRAGTFSSSVNVTLAICVSVLAVIGIMRTFSRGPSDSSGSERGGWLDFILLPYTAMAVAMLLVLLLLLLRRIGQRRGQRVRWLRRDFLREHPDPVDRNRQDERDRTGQAGRGE